MRIEGHGRHTHVYVCIHILPISHYIRPCGTLPTGRLSRAGQIAQLVKFLLRKLEALSLIASTHTKNVRLGSMCLLSKHWGGGDWWIPACSLVR